MSGVNATGTLAALPIALFVAGERCPPHGAAAPSCGWWLVGAALASRVVARTAPAARALQPAVPRLHRDLRGDHLPDRMGQQRAGRGPLGRRSTTVDGRPWWPGRTSWRPAGPLAVLGSVVTAVGLVGLVHRRMPLRTPLVLSLVVGPGVPHGRQPLRGRVVRRRAGARAARRAAGRPPQRAQGRPAGPAARGGRVRARHRAGPPPTAAPARPPVGGAPPADRSPGPDRAAGDRPPGRCRAPPDGRPPDSRLDRGAAGLGADRRLPRPAAGEPCPRGARSRVRDPAVGMDDRRAAPGGGPGALGHAQSGAADPGPDGAGARRRGAAAGER